MNKNRIYLSLIFLYIISIVLFLRIIHIQVLQHNKFINYSISKYNNSSNYLKIRGDIYDRNMNILATDIEIYDIAVNTKLIKNKLEFIELISKHIKIDKDQLVKKMNIQKSFLPLNYYIDKNKYLELKKMDIKGLLFQKKYKRYYPYGEIISNVIGVVGVDRKGLAGVELNYDNKLFNEFQDSYLNLKLSIDLHLQCIAYYELKNAIEKFKAKDGFVIIQNPNTGEILALSCYPSFDPNNYKFTNSDLLNPAINKIFEPGSTFKIVTACAALSEGIYNKNDIIYCENGSYKIFEDVEINDHEKYNYLTFEGILAYSSNIGFAKVGSKIGKEKLYFWIRNFGFGSLTEIDYPAEAQGIVPSPYTKKWSFVTCPIISFGQGISVTGIQLINSYSTIANGGLLFRPVLVKQIINNKNKIIYTFQPQIIRRVITEKTSEEIKTMLSKVVEYGTGILAKVNGYNVAGKTGTAQKVDPETKKYSESAYTVSFCGFLPVELPVVTILVVINQPQENYWASQVACPIFKSIATKSINYLNIPRINKKNKQLITKLCY